MPKLTKRTVEALETPTDGDVVVWDNELPGFGLRLWPSGKRSYLVKYRTHEGRQRKVTIGTHGSITAEEARDEARRYLGAASLGQDRGKAKSDHRSAPTVADLTRRYIEEHARTKKRPRSVEEDERLIRLHILPRLGNTKVAAITRQDVLRLNHDMRDRPGAANRTRALLSKMFNLAEKWGLRADGSNPCRHVEKYPENKLERFLNREELARLGAVLARANHDGTEMPSAIAAIRLLLLTGCRRSEILTLKWSEVDFEKQCLRLRESKTGAKTVYLCKPALKLLRSLPRDPKHPYVIAGDKPGSHLVNLRKAWHRLRSKAELKDVRIHDLRHSFASAAASGGGSLPMIGRLLGHSQAQTTERYAHLAADPLRALNEATGKHIAEAMDAIRGESASSSLPKR
jgi:integrase